MQGERNRDESVERVLRQSFREPQTSRMSEACLDAETLAAWTDHALNADETVIVEAHVSGCARCQALLATFVSTTPEAAVAESVWQRWHLRWLVPLATAATAVAFWFVIPGNDSQRGKEVLAEPVTVERQSSIAQPAGASPTTPETSTPPAQDPNRLATASTPAETTRRNEAASAPAANTSRSAGASAPAAEIERRDQLARIESVGRSSDAAAAPVAGLSKQTSDTSARVENRVAEAPREAQARQSVDQFAAAPQVASEKAEADRDRVATVGARPDAAPAPAPAAPPAPARSVGALRAAVASRVGAPLEILSPNPAVRWRITAGRIVERSTNGGARWETVALPASDALTAGVSPSMSVSWIVGRAGTVLLTVDGQRFARVTFPEAIDLVSVRATDDRNATVIASDGRSFRTSNAGATWNRVTP